jgi:uncharacterized cupredoxin-like copper-binding protein
MRITPWTTLAAALVLTNAACTVDRANAENGSQVESRAAAPNVVTVTATDFAFAAPATIPAGLTTVRLVSQGREMHHAQLVKLEEGHTVEDLTKADPHGPIPSWARFVGGPNAPGPNGAEATMDLQPGTYALVCLIPSADGVPHLMKGMIKGITVVAPEQPSQARAEVADVRMTLRDYAFEFTPEIAAGHHVISVENEAAQPHEVVFLKLAPGKTPQDLLAWMEKMDGPPPAMPMGGTALLSTGEENQVAIDFTPGEYVLLCMVPDARDGAPHVAHGMVRQITVR